VVGIKNISTTLKEVKVVKAMLKRMRLWRFSPVKGEENFKITYTFDFAPVGLSSMPSPISTG